MIQSQIILGFIASTEFAKEMVPMYNPKYIESKMAKLVIGWCVSYYNEFQEAPKMVIQQLYFKALKDGLDESMAQEIEEDILPDLNERYISEGINVELLIRDTKAYFQERSLKIHNDEVAELLEAGEVEEAQAKISSYRPWEGSKINYIDLSKVDALIKVKNALNEAFLPLFHFPGALGEFLNSQLIAGGFIAFLASEKRGKTWWLLEMAITAARQHKKVAFFQAGDMTESQQLKRIATYLTKKPSDEKYLGESWEAVKDCVHNQLDTCDHEDRECSFGPFSEAGMQAEELRNKIDKDMILEAIKTYPDYKPCHNCAKYKTEKWGSVWMKREDITEVLTAKSAVLAVKKFFMKFKREFRISTHANGTLSVNNIKNILKDWEKEDGFVPDLIIIDYADILISDVKTEFRHQENEKWKALRGLSQIKPWLVVTVTQADAKSYDAVTLKQSNFSEDKRKYAHVTAMYGINQDPHGREKKIGLMRLNELVIREGDGLTSNVVHVLQNLKVGKPFLTSYM